MNTKEKIQVIENLRKYHTPGCTDSTRRPNNAVFVSIANSLKHEMSKLIGMYQLKKYGDIKLTDSIIVNLNLIDHLVRKEMGEETTGVNGDCISEAVPNEDPNRRIDLVYGVTNTRYEFETDIKIKKDGAFTFYI